MSPFLDPGAHDFYMALVRCERVTQGMVAVYTPIMNIATKWQTRLGVEAKTKKNEGGDGGSHKDSWIRHTSFNMHMHDTCKRTHKRKIQIHSTQPFFVSLSSLFSSIP